MNPSGGMIVILKDFTFVAASGQSFATDWVSFPVNYKQADYVVEVKSSASGNAVTCLLQGSYDTDTAVSISSILATGQAVTVSSPTSGFTPMIRVRFTATADSAMVVSIYVIPKMS